MHSKGPIVVVQEAGAARERTRAALAADGYNVVCVDSVERALDVLAQSAAGLVFVDLEDPAVSSAFVHAAVEAGLADPYRVVMVANGDGRCASPARWWVDHHASLDLLRDIVHDLVGAPPPREEPIPSSVHAPALA